MAGLTQRLVAQLARDPSLSCTVWLDDGRFGEVC
jgi:hypothetical protein